LSYSIKTFHGQSGLQEASPVWDTLAAQMTSAHYFHLSAWYESYLAALEDRPDEVVFCVLFDDQTPAALLPLKRETRTVAGIRLRTLELPRHDHLHLRDIVVADAYRDRLSLATITHQVQRCRDLRWDVLALWHVLDDSGVMNANKLEAPKFSVCQPKFGCSHMTMAPSWDEFQKRLSKNFRQQLRTKKNRAKTMGDVTFEVVRTLPQLDRALDEFIAVEASGWKAKEGTAIGSSELLKKFYLHLTRRFGAQDLCEIHLMKHAGKPIGGLYLLVTGDTLYMPKLGYDEEYSRLSPVQSLLEQVFGNPRRRPEIKRFNLTSDAPWFDVWQPTKSMAHNIYVFNTTVMGLAAGAAMGLSERFKRKNSASQPAVTAAPAAASDEPSASE
jgi:CelD/BcsL family acetyltransferase involved in cellulose biosynthesis